VSIPAPLQKIVDEFKAAPAALRLPLLLEYANRLAPLPEGMDGTLERVAECVTPLFLKVELEGDHVRLYFEAPAEAPTTRGFAAVIHEGLDGATTDQVMSVPDDFYQEMGLAELISPLRLRGMGAIVARVKRQLTARSA
jgi:cysteine desulfuration protein SufE